MLSVIHDTSEVRERRAKFMGSVLDNVLAVPLSPIRSPCSWLLAAFNAFPFSDCFHCVPSLGIHSVGRQLGVMSRDSIN